MTTLFLDFETRSEISLPDRGLSNYVLHKSTQALMLGWTIENAKPKLWQAREGKFDSELQDALTDPHVTKAAFNSPFEINVFRHVLKMDIPVEQWLDVLVWARHMSVTGDLEEVGEIFGIKQDEAKIKDGKRLIAKFCQPQYKGGEETLFGISEPWFADWESDPDDWALFCEYCKQDVIAERAIFRKMKNFPLPELQQKEWVLDQTINDRGIPIDLGLVQASARVAEKTKAELHTKLQAITKAENPNSNPQLLAWLKTQGYTFSSIGKPFVARAISGECDLTAAALEVINLRKQSAKTSDSKLDVIVNQVSQDGRLRHQLSFMGAARTGREAGKDTQPQNLPTPAKEVKNNLDLAIDLLRQEDYTGLSLEFPSIMDVVAGTLRSAVKPPTGNKLAVADESAIENRIIGWVTKCDAITQVFRDKRDPYLDFATKMYDLTYEQVLAEYKAGDKTKRTNAKPATLGCGFGLGGGEEKQTKDGDIYKSGLWGYAWNMGIKLTQEEAHKAVDIFRKAYPEVVDFWYALEEAAVYTIRTKKATREGRIRRNGETVSIPLPVTLQCFGNKLLRILLPSGRGLHYIQPKIEKTEMNGRMKDGITCMGKDTKTKQWVRIKTYGGKLTENIVQAIARDVLFDAMLRTDALGLPIVLHIHDEIVAELSQTSPLGLSELRQAMMTPPAWAPDLLLGAEGYETTGPYRKD